MSRLLIGVLVGSCFISGCTSIILSDEHLIANTADALGIPQKELTITDRRNETPNTYYTVTTRSGKKYACIINVENSFVLGTTNLPTCAKK